MTDGPKVTFDLSALKADVARSKKRLEEAQNDTDDWSPLDTVAVYGLTVYAVVMVVLFNILDRGI